MKKKSNRYEQHIANLNEQKRKIEYMLKNENDSNKEKIILIKIILDSINLAKEIIPDIEMYKLAMEDYNNPILYQGHYYLYYSILKINMITERIANFLGIVFETTFFENREKNNVRQIRDNLKDKLKTKRYTEYINSEIKGKFDSLLGDKKWEILKIFRDLNEHGVSVHLDDVKELAIENLAISKDIEKYLNSYSIKNGKFDAERYENAVIENIINFNINKNFEKEVLGAIEDKFVKIINIIKDMIDICNSDVSNVINIKSADLYMWDFNVDKIDKRIYKLKEDNKYLPVIVDELLTKSIDIKHKIVKRFDKIKSTLELKRCKNNFDYEMYICDVAFRTSEYIRNTNNIFYLLNGGEFYIVEDGSEKKCDFINADYFYYAVILKLSSCYEKIGKAIYIMLNLEQYDGEKNKLKNKYFKRVIEIAINEKNSHLEPIEIANKIINKEEYKEYMNIRNKMYHGIRENVILKESERSIDFINNICIILECFADLLELIDSMNYLAEERFRSSIQN